MTALASSKVIHACARLTEQHCRECEDVRDDDWTSGKHPDGRWSTLFLHADRMFERHCPGVLAKILRRVRAGARPSILVWNIECNCLDCTAACDNHNAH